MKRGRDHEDVLRERSRQKEGTRKEGRICVQSCLRVKGRGGLDDLISFTHPTFDQSRPFERDRRYNLRGEHFLYLVWFLIRISS